jgi:hypothetical protein
LSFLADKFFYSSVFHHQHYLVQRVNPRRLVFLAFVVGPLGTGAIKAGAVAFQPLGRLHLNVLAECFCRYISFVKFGHLLTELPYYLLP